MLSISKSYHPRHNNWPEVNIWPRLGQFKILFETFLSGTGRKVYLLCGPLNLGSLLLVQPFRVMAGCFSTSNVILIVLTGAPSCSSLLFLDNVPSPSIKPPGLESNLIRPPTTYHLELSAVVDFQLAPLIPGRFYSWFTDRFSNIIHASFLVISKST